ncbi:MAG TPA: UDPGP type 1 family protein [Phycisphaerae bacterium]|jgi:UDP-N-acetylglucosamine/UDP-N-acetylgalactosamine diphosphorylase|nr:UDPGP type 1 family protein [Phycisphaerae bacterium]HOB75694.1 UDPGP type 1 family protein [Phycisphaerae bacterium]HOJ53306.1 UDPGP type 1 family protein [Phycisphaerae bacterium]HOL27469.1 UDPGP type 1 family protein [Phycisphaerae bacterium]HPP21665.1 UDPGP type 1 family protein [Phycisphaerae bacterium]
MAAAGSDRLARIRKTLQEHGQEHLLAHWDTLNDEQRGALLADIEQVNFSALTQLVERNVRRQEPFPLPHDIQPVPFYPAQPGIDLVGKYADAIKRGTSLIRQNKVCGFTVAGGQGTRLGFDGPKGAFPISPVKNKPLFQLFAEYIRGTNRRYGSDLTWYIMTSPQNDAQTKAFFAENGYFGMDPKRVRFFQQGVMPAFSPEGKILLDQKHRIAFSPDGHGGSLLALRNSGALAEMAEAGVEYISYWQVDNPLVKAIDPLFIGLHDLTGSQMSSKTIPKVDDLERVGNFVVGDGRTMVIEYSDLPDELAHARNEAGTRKFDAGSIGIHVLSRSFVEELTADASHFGLPWHRAIKKVPYVDASGRRVEPTSPNAVKLEAFIFDAIPLARNPLVLQTSRAEEFSPVKNATGVDSAETSRRDMNRRAAAWLDGAGYDVPRKADGEPDGLFEISSLLALDAGHLREVMLSPPTIRAGQAHYWE